MKIDWMYITIVFSDGTERRIAVREPYLDIQNDPVVDLAASLERGSIVHEPSWNSSITITGHVEREQS